MSTNISLNSSTALIFYCNSKEFYGKYKKLSAWFLPELMQSIYETYQTDAIFPRSHNFFLQKILFFL